MQVVGNHDALERHIHADCLDDGALALDVVGHDSWSLSQNPATGGMTFLMFPIRS